MTARFLPLSVRGISPAMRSFAAQVLDLDADPPGEWRLRALCAEIGTEIFYMEAGESPKPAKRICAACTVRPECLEQALADGEEWGIWGGLSRRQRVALQRARDAAAVDAEQVAA